jgi:hypothetical protein
MVPPSPSLILESWGNTLLRGNGSEWLRWMLKQGGVILQNDTLNHTQLHLHPTQITETIGCFRTSLSLLSTHPRILVAC